MYMAHLDTNKLIKNTAEIKSNDRKFSHGGIVLY